MSIGVARIEVSSHNIHYHNFAGVGRQIAKFFLPGLITLQSSVHYQREHWHVLSEVSGQRNARNARNVRNVTKLRHYWIGQSQPSANTAYAAGTPPSCGRYTP